MQAGLTFRSTLDRTYSAQRFSFFSLILCLIFILDQLSGAGEYTIIRQLLPREKFY